MTGLFNGLIAEVAKREEIRAYVEPELKRTIKAIAGLKNSGRDWSISDVVTEALEDWLKKPENAELVKRHKLDELK
jgi:hypothetical protein